jgi:hypothetical protein
MSKAAVLGFDLIYAGIAATSAGSQFLSKLKLDGGSSLKDTNAYLKNYLNQGTKVKPIYDGPIAGIDPPGTVGHKDGYPIDKNGRYIETNNPYGLSSYGLIEYGQAVKDSIKQLLDPRKGDIKKGSKYGKMKDLSDRLINNPNFMKDYAKIINDTLSKGGQEPFKGVWPHDIPAKAKTYLDDWMTGDKEAYKRIIDKMREIDPSFQLIPSQKIIDRWPDIDDPTDTTKDIDDPSTDTTDDKAKPNETGKDGGGKIKIPTEPGTDTTTDTTGTGTTTDTTGGIDTTGTGDMPKPKGPKRDPKVDPRPIPKTDKKDDDDKRKPPRIPEQPDHKDKKKKEEEKITEKEIQAKIRNQKKPRLWMPEYSFGGQNLLKLTDVEKLEELRNFTLFDLVNPLLSGDQDNLLAIQNKIQEQRRFYNTYPAPKPEPPLPQIPRSVNQWSRNMYDTMPTKYPFRLDQAHSQNYYDHYANDKEMYLNKKLDDISSVYNPDLQQILNSKRPEYSATDPRIMPGSAKFSLLEGLDSSKIDNIDLMMLK